MNIAIVLLAALATAWAAQEARGKPISLHVILAVGLAGSLAKPTGIFR